MATASQRPTRERLLDAAADLLHRKGYSATGLSEVTERAKTPKGSLYFHFPGGKEQLGAEALAASGARFREGIQAIVKDAPDGPSAVRDLAGMLALGLSSTDYQLGCPIATTTLEAASSSPLIRDAADRAFGSWIAALQERLSADGYNDAAANKLSIFVLSALEGAMVLARATQSTAALDIASEALADLVDHTPLEKS